MTMQKLKFRSGETYSETFTSIYFGFIPESFFLCEHVNENVWRVIEDFTGAAVPFDNPV